MKKVYTVTFQRVLNYGAVLQAYALMKFLKTKNFDVEVLDYAPSYFLLQTYRPAKGLQKSIDKYKKFHKFKDFRTKFMTLTPKTYYSLNALNKLPAGHAAICGSDQIWNLNLTNKKFDPVFFLDFAKGDTKRIAFAASAGSIRLNDFAPLVKKTLESFDSIGVRESILAEDVKEIAPDTHPVVVVDPCLLIQDYSEVFDDSRIPNGDFIVSYVVGSGEMLECFNDRIKEFKKYYDIPVIHLGSKGIDAADISILDIGPSDWITFIKRAKYVVTNSFHGTAFSINFEKDFIFVAHIVSNLNARQTTLLKSVGLMDRMLKSDEVMTENKISVIDYKQVTPMLHDHVSQSQNFIIESLK
jgi:hypothetical protein